jgi:hypothetical protein
MSVVSLLQNDPAAAAPQQIGVDFVHWQAGGMYLCFMHASLMLCSSAGILHVMHPC